MRKTLLCVKIQQLQLYRHTQLTSPRLPHHNLNPTSHLLPQFERQQLGAHCHAPVDVCQKHCCDYNTHTAATSPLTNRMSLSMDLGTPATTQRTP